MNLYRTNHRRQRGYALVEIAASYAAIVIVGLVTLKSTLNNVTGQQWTVRQAMTDAYMTRETALASRMPFATIRSGSSPWPMSPSVNTQTVVVGKLPGGDNVTATLHRTRIPDGNNLGSGSGSGNNTTNPSLTEAWKLQSVIVYSVRDKNYVKTRTTLRIR
ncbi:MAG: hypothetical protein P1U58_04180 [Verrucomicrobiales bacterium]|nr:hypothetical protein [Verrucomicrobiales bacterium]